MAHIVIFGGTGFLGRNILAEAAARGHSIDSVSPTRVIDGSPKDEVSFERGSIFDAELVERVARGADVIVVSMPAGETDGKSLVEALPALFAASQEDGVRLGFVSGAGTLAVSEGGPLLLDTPEFPAEALDEARGHQSVLEALKASESDVDWFALSPSAEFGATHPGEATETFRLGEDTLLVGPGGTSSISAADFAHAFVDEIDRPQHNRARFTVGY